MNLTLTDDIRTRLMNVYVTLKSWPDVRDVLRVLKEQHMRLAFLSNMTKMMLDANIRSAGLDGVFDEIISSDAIQSTSRTRAFINLACTLSISSESKYCSSRLPVGTPPVRLPSATPHLGVIG